MGFLGFRAAPIRFFFTHLPFGGIYQPQHWLAHFLERGGCSALSRLLMSGPTGFVVWDWPICRLRWPVGVLWPRAVTSNAVIFSLWWRESRVYGRLERFTSNVFVQGLTRNRTEPNSRNWTENKSQKNRSRRVPVFTQCQWFTPSIYSHCRWLRPETCVK